MDIKKIDTIDEVLQEVDAAESKRIVGDNQPEKGSKKPKESYVNKLEKRKNVVVTKITSYGQLEIYMGTKAYRNKSVPEKIKLLQKCYKYFEEHGESDKNMRKTLDLIDTLKLKRLHHATTSKSALQTASSTNLRRYIESAPQYKLLSQQISIIEKEIEEYKKLGNLDASEMLEQKLIELKQSRKKFTDVYEPKSKEEIEQINDAIAKSPAIKTYKEEINKLDSINRVLNPSNLFSTINKIIQVIGKYDAKNSRGNDNLDDLLDYVDDVDFGALDINVDSIDNVDFNDPDILAKIGNAVKNIKSYAEATAKLRLIFHYLAYRLDCTYEEVNDMYYSNRSQLQREYSKTLTDAEKLNNETYWNKRKIIMTNINRESNAIKGFDVATGVMMDIFKYDSIEDDKKSLVNSFIQIVPNAKPELLADFAERIMDDVYYGSYKNPHTGRSGKKYVTLDYRTNEQTFATVDAKVDSILTEFKYKNPKVRKAFKDIIYKKFDSLIDKERKPKDMLASSYVKYVEKIAYNICAKLNKLHYLEDAIAFGLLGLSKVLDKWYKMQKESPDVGVTLDGPYMGIIVSTEIKKGLLTLSISTMSGTNAATKLHFTAEHNKFLKENPELAGLSEDLINNLVELCEIPQITNESEYNATIEGEDGKGRSFENITDNENEDNEAENVQLYRDVVNSIKELVTLAEIKVKVDPNTGKRTIVKTGKPMFTAEEYELLKLYFGMIEKYDPSANEGEQYRPYNQSEMAEYLMNFLKRTKGVTKTYSQSAISDKINKTLIPKLKRATELYPGIRKGLKFLAERVMANPEAFSRISKNREALEDVDYNDTLGTNFEGKIILYGMSGKSLGDLDTKGDFNKLEAEIEEDLASITD